VAFLALHLAVKPLKRTEDGALMTLIELALILVYTCVLLIKTCTLSEDICAKYGFGRKPSGVYLFFVVFGLSMVLLLLIIAAVKVCVTGRLPKLLLVARAHGVSPWTIVQKVLARRQEKSSPVATWPTLRHQTSLAALLTRPSIIQTALRRLGSLQRRVARMLRLDVNRLTPRTAAAVLQYRTTAAVYRATPPAGTPSVVIPTIVGGLADLSIKGVFPRTTCFANMDV
jgi:hypothetical protein